MLFRFFLLLICLFTFIFIFNFNFFLFHLYFISLSLHFPPFLLLYSIRVSHQPELTKILCFVSFHPSLNPVQPYWLSPRLLITAPCASSHIESAFRCRLSFLLGLYTPEDGTDTLSRNVGKQLPHDAA
jgi:hypothetical protein